MSIMSRNHNMSADRLGAIYYYASQLNPTLPLTDKDTKVADPKQDQIQAGLKAVAKYGDDAITNFLKLTQGGTDPQKAAQSVHATETVKQAPNLALYPDGLVGTDKKTGLRWRVYPDGRKERED